MMKKILWGLLLVFLGAGMLQAQESKEGIRFFEGTFQEALDLAKRENKLIFLDCSGTWCGGCRQMEKQVFPVKEVGDFFNANFINLERMMNMEGEGTAIAKRYDITGYPTWLFVNGEGYVVHKSAGYMEPTKFIELAKAALAAPRVGSEERFAKGERDTEFVKGYLKELLSYVQADKVEELLDKLCEEQGGKILKDPDYWRAFQICTYNPDALTSLYLVKNWKKVAKWHGVDAVLQKIRNIYVSWAAYESLKVGATARRSGKFSEEKKEAYLQKMAERKLPDCTMLQEEMNFLVLLQADKDQEACELGERVLKNADARTLRNWAVFGERRLEGDLRQVAAGWVKRALEMRNDADFQAECTELLNDLTQSKSPKYGVFRPSMPMRGHEGKFVKGKK